MPSDVTEDRAMTNGTDPNAMTVEGRLAEVSMLLSLAMVRLWRKRRDGGCRAASRERGFSRDSAGNSLGSPAETRPPVAAVAGWRL
jgi:hypothetical protein